MRSLWSAFLTPLGLVCAFGTSAVAAEPGAQGVTRLFIDACIPNMGNPDGVRAWATDHHLGEIQTQPALELFVGPGDGGAAWAEPTSSGNFALAIRAKTKACVAYAQKADPSETLAKFKSIVEGVKKLGVKLKIERDTTTSTASGNVHTLAYDVWAPKGAISYVFMIMTVDRPNAGFQAWLEVAKATLPDETVPPDGPGGI